MENASSTSAPPVKRRLFVLVMKPSFRFSIASSADV
jgi:hypothetical protein